MSAVRSGMRHAACGVRHSDAAAFGISAASAALLQRRLEPEGVRAPRGFSQESWPCLPSSIFRCRRWLQAALQQARIYECRCRKSEFQIPGASAALRRCVG
eukprot:11351830-Alexandrium_andersonii.AAC.1